MVTFPGLRCRSRGPENAKGWLQKRLIFGECARPPGFFLGAFDLVKRYFDEQHRL